MRILKQLRFHSLFLILQRSFSPQRNPASAASQTRWESHTITIQVILSQSKISDERRVNQVIPPSLHSQSHPFFLLASIFVCAQEGLGIHNTGVFSGSHSTGAVVLLATTSSIEKTILKKTIHFYWQFLSPKCVPKRELSSRQKKRDEKGRCVSSAHTAKLKS